MPANLTPQYHAAEAAFKAARSREEKLAALEEMLAVIPKHKGTEKIQADIKRRMARLREEQDKRAGVSTFNPFVVEREGAGQVVLLGCPNAGKSALVGALTRAKVNVADYPFSTPLPVAGMMPFENILIQLVDTPPVTHEEINPEMIGTLRNADALLLVVDASSGDCLSDLDALTRHLTDRRIIRPEPIEGIRSHTWDECLLVATKSDAGDSGDHIEMMREMAPRGLDILAVSATAGSNLEELRRRLFQLLGVIRIYSKVPGKEPDMTAPFVIEKGSTVVDFAGEIHRDFPKKLKAARVWGSSRFEGQVVPRDYILADGDIVELQIR